MKVMKNLRILTGVLIIYLFCHCSHRGHDTYIWYDSLTGYQDAVKFARNNASILDNSFFYGEIYLYSIWSYYSINGSTYIIVYKFHEKNLISFRVYNYSGNIEWLKQFDEEKVSSTIFWKFPAGDDFPLAFNLKIGNKITTYNFYPDFYAFLANDTIENDFLRNLRNDIIKYNLIELSTSK